MKYAVLVLALVACKQDDKPAPKPAPAKAETPKREVIVQTLGNLEAVELDGAYVVRSTDGKLRIPFPGKPQLIDNSQQGPNGRVDIRLAIYEDTDRMFAYMVAASSVPSPLPGKSFDLERVYNAARDGMVTNLKGTITRDENTQFVGLPARIVEFDHVMEGVSLRQRHRMLYVGPQNTAYTIGGGYNQGDRAGGDRVEKLFDQVTLK